MPSGETLYSYGQTFAENTKLQGMKWTEQSFRIDFPEAELFWVVLLCLSSGVSGFVQQTSWYRVDRGCLGPPGDLGDLAFDRKLPPLHEDQKNTYLSFLLLFFCLGISSLLSLQVFILTFQVQEEHLQCAEGNLFFIADCIFYLSLQCLVNVTVTGEFMAAGP